MNETPQTNALVFGMRNVLSLEKRLDGMVQHSRKMESKRDVLLAALEAMLVGEGLHNVGCKELPPGYDDSKCCPVHIARTAIAKAA